MTADKLLGILSDKKILYAEDEAGIRQNIEEILRLFFMEVTTVADGEAVLDEMALNHYDVLMLDIAMPRLDGLEAVKILRQGHPHIPIIILSAYSTQEYLWRAVELKITRYLTKPHTKESLIEALEQAAKELTTDTPGPIPLTQELRYLPCTKRLQRSGTYLPLSLTESRLMEYFIRHKNCAVTFEAIADYLWGYDPHSKEAIKSLIKDLRRKIGAPLIQNIYGIGYRFVLEPREEVPPSSG